MQWLQNHPHLHNTLIEISSEEDCPATDIDATTTCDESEGADIDGERLTPAELFELEHLELQKAMMLSGSAPPGRTLAWPYHASSEPASGQRLWDIASRITRKYRLRLQRERFQKTIHVLPTHVGGDLLISFGIMPHMHICRIPIPC